MRGTHAEPVKLHEKVALVLEFAGARTLNVYEVGFLPFTFGMSRYSFARLMMVSATSVTFLFVSGGVVEGS